MTKRAVLICAVACASIAISAITASWFFLHSVPSPFESVTLRGNTVIAKLRPDVSFGLVRGSTHVGEHISGSESIELQDGESIILGSPRTGYQITCRTSLRPAGLYVAGHWFVHDYIRSTEKIWFLEAH